jgi:hypothetical protein
MNQLTAGGLFDAVSGQMGGCLSKKRDMPALV